MSLENTRDIGTAKIVMVGAGGGASSLADLTDTNISNPSNGQVLEYDSASSKWINATGGSGGQYQNVRYAKINTQETQSSVIYLKTDLVHNLATGDELKVYDIVYLESDTLRVLPTGYSWKVGIKVDNTNYVDFVLEKSGANWTGVIPANSLLVLELIISPSVATKYAYVRGVITDDGFVRSGAKSGTTIGANATAEGYQTTASGLKSHAEGELTSALGTNSHAEGMSTTADETASHAEGSGSQALGVYSHAEGYQSIAYDSGCHAEGYQTKAGTTSTSSDAYYAHAEGGLTVASGNYSHAGGYRTQAQYDYQRAIGKYNDNKRTTLLEVGNGTGTSARSNAFEVYSDGKISCDNGSSKFQFTQSGGVDGYNDASGTFHAFGGDSYALVGMGQVTSYSNKVAETNVYLHRAPKEGDRLFIKFSPTITDSDAQIKIYDQYSGTAYTLSFNVWASGSKLAGLCLLEVQDDGLGTLGLALKYSFEGGTNYTAGAGIEINGSAISNTAPNYGVDVDGATISSVSSGNLGTYVGESKYLILYFSASASPYSGGYTLTLSYSGSVAIQEYGTLYDGSSRYNSNISAGTMLLCEVTSTGTGSSADPVHVNIIGKIDPNSGGGNTVSKTRYQISSSSWSSSANSDGFYTLTTTLNPAIGSSPDVYVAGSADGTQPTDTEKGQFAYVKRCKVNGSTLTLYASSKPSSTFYIWVEGVNGTGSGDIVGNVIQPNGESSGGESYSTTEEIIGTWGNKTLYRKAYNFGALPNTGTKEVDDTNLIGVKIKRLYGIANSTQNYVSIPLPFLTTGVSTAYVQLMAFFAPNNYKIRVVTGEDRSAFDDVWIVVEYTKS